MTGFQRLCVVTCVVVFGLIVLGGVVRATDSGDGCPDWPTCHGSSSPGPTSTPSSSTPTAPPRRSSGFSFSPWASSPGATTATCRASSTRHLLAFVLVLVQGGLGGAAVLNDLAAEIVTVHLGLALTILALLILITTTAFDLRNAVELALPPA